MGAACTRPTFQFSFFLKKGTRLRGADCEGADEPSSSPNQTTSNSILMSKFFVIACLLVLSSAYYSSPSWHNFNLLVGMDCSSQPLPYNLYCQCNLDSDCYGPLTCDDRFKITLGAFSQSRQASNNSRDNGR